MILADAAAVRPDGLLDVHRGGWSDYGCSQFPDTVRGALCGFVEVEGTVEEVPVLLQVDVVAPDRSEFGSKAEILVWKTGAGRRVAPFAIEFSFVVREPGSAVFRVKDEAGVILAEVELSLVERSRTSSE